jgi:hypothetical protein
LESLRREIDDRGLEIAPGTFIAETSARRMVAVRLAPALKIEAEYEPVEVEELLDALRRQGCVQPATGQGDLAPDCGAPVTEFMKDGLGPWSVLFGLNDALYVPVDVPVAVRRLLAWRYIASFPKPLAAAVASVGRGDAGLVGIRPSAVLSKALDGLPPPEGDVALLSGASAAWRLLPLKARVGRLRPAASISVGSRRGMFVAAAEVLPSPGGLGEDGMSGSGIAVDRDDAKKAAVGEAYERHCAGVVPAESILAASGKDLPGALPPDQFVSYRESQLERGPNLISYSAAQPRLWAKASRSDGEAVHVLADLVFFPFGRGGIACHTHANSSGMAAHESFARAEDAAWRELVERDAFMRHWLGRRPGRRIAVPAGDRAVERLVASIEAAGWALRLVQLGESSELPIVAAIATCDSHLVIGASVASPRVAIAKACSEAWAGVCLPREPEEVPAVEAVSTPSDHRRLYRWGDHVKEAAFLWDCDEEVGVDQLGEPPPMPASAAVFRWPPYVSAPLKVVRVLCPSMIPITFGFGCEPLGRPDAAALVEATGRVLDEGLFPHPFP